MSFRLASRLMTLDNLELLQVRIFLEFRAISHIWKATTAKRMEIDPRCKRQNCNPLNVLLIDVYISSILLGIPPLGATITIHWAKMAMAAKNACRNCLFLLARRYASAKWNSVKWNGTHLRCHWVQVVLLSRRIGAIFGMLSRRADLSAIAGLSCLLI